MPEAPSTAVCEEEEEEELALALITVPVAVDVAVPVAVAGPAGPVGAMYEGEESSTLAPRQVEEDDDEEKQGACARCASRWPRTSRA